MTPPGGGWPPDEQSAERMRRQRALAERLAEQQRLDAYRRQVHAEFGAHADDHAGSGHRGQRRRRTGRRQRQSGNRFVAMLAVVALVAGVLTAERWSDSGAGGIGWTGSGTVFGQRTTAEGRPSPPSDASDTPLGNPPPRPQPGGSYAFVQMRPDAPDKPVTYDPCRTIRYVVNDAAAPPGADVMLAQAIDATSAATGLVFEYSGTTDEAPDVKREAYQPDRYGDQWAPVVIGWTTPEQQPDLADAVAGQGGSAWLEVDDVEVDGRRVTTATFVTGVIALDGPQIEMIARESPQGVAAARAVVLHELGHVVGLQHVNDPTELMNPENSAGVTDFAAGDLLGLNELGRGPCTPEI
nr:matrixin family metalloprotease [Candidatus Microthrix sp.]